MMEPLGKAAARLLAELEARKRKQGQGKGKPGMAPLPLRAVANARQDGNGIDAVGFRLDTKAVTENAPDRSQSGPHPVNSRSQFRIATRFGVRE